jgi:outer membrane protein
MRKSIGWTLALLTATVFLARAPYAWSQAPLKIGVFDSQRISEESAEGKRVQAALSAMRDAKQEEIKAKEQVIADLQQRLNQQGLSLSAAARTNLELDIQRKMLEVNTAKDLASRELQLEIAAAESLFNDKLRQVVNQVGRDEGFAVLLEAAAVAWASNTIDVTTAIIDQFDNMYPPEPESE